MKLEGGVSHCGGRGARCQVTWLSLATNRDVSTVPHGFVLHSKNLTTPHQQRLLMVSQCAPQRDKTAAIARGWIPASSRPPEKHSAANQAGYPPAAASCLRAAVRAASRT